MPSMNDACAPVRQRLADRRRLLARDLQRAGERRPRRLLRCAAPEPCVNAVDRVA